MPDGSVHEFLPDYLVGFKDGAIGVFETGPQDAFAGDKAIENQAKVKALREWAERQRGSVEVGFLFLDHGKVRLYTAPESASSAS